MIDFPEIENLTRKTSSKILMVVVDGLGGYFDNATKILRTKTETYSKVIGVNPTEIRVKQYKSRWGSCNSKGVISYNWRIIMSP